MIRVPAIIRESTLLPHQHGNSSFEFDPLLVTNQSYLFSYYSAMQSSNLIRIALRIRPQVLSSRYGLNCTNIVTTKPSPVLVRSAAFSSRLDQVAGGESRRRPNFFGVVNSWSLFSNNSGFVRELLTLRDTEYFHLIISSSSHNLCSK